MRGPYAAIAALLVLSPLAVTRECDSNPLYSAKSFRGDGKIEDNGLWTTPRYVISFPEIPLNRPGKYTYSVMLDWRHPRQAWALFSRPSYNQSLTSGSVVAWNRVVEKFSPQPSPAVERGT
jgi:hypothetical protein